MAWTCSSNKLTIEDLSSFIEVKVKEVCRFEIDSLKFEGSASYANELIISLQNEKKELQEKLQELGSHHIILKQEANSLREENKSLLTVIRLMSNELQNLNVPTTSTNLHDQISERVNGIYVTYKSPWVLVNNVKSKQRNTRKRSNKAKLSTNANPSEPHQPTKDRNQISHQNSNAAQKMQNPSLSVPCGNPSPDHKLIFVAGDSIIQHVKGWELTTNEKHVAVKSFSGARIADMEDYLRSLLRKGPDEIILHVGTNNIRDESLRSVAEGIVIVMTRIQPDFPTTHLSISPLLPRSDNLELSDKIKVHMTRNFLLAYSKDLLKS